MSENDNWALFILCAVLLLMTITICVTIYQVKALEHLGVVYEQVPVYAGPTALQTPK
jgi:hypothetical protein